MNREIINKYHPLRQSAEQFIKDEYKRVFGAKIKSFPNVLLALVENNQVKAACGIRTELDGFFSQVYVDQPFKKIIKEQIKSNKPFYFAEIVNFVSSGPLSSIRLVKEINKYFIEQNLDYTVFSASGPLKLFLSTMGLMIEEICPASPSRISNLKDWGSYYESKPIVCFLKIPSVQFSLLFKNLKQLDHVEFANLAQ